MDIKHNGQWKIAKNKVHTFFGNLVYFDHRWTHRHMAIRTDRQADSSGTPQPRKHSFCKVVKITAAELQEEFATLNYLNLKYVLKNGRVQGEIILKQGVADTSTSCKTSLQLPKFVKIFKRITSFKTSLCYQCLFYFQNNCSKTVVTWIWYMFSKIAKFKGR